MASSAMVGESKTSRQFSLKRKFHQWLLKLYREDALDEREQVKQPPPDVGDLVEILLALGFRLKNVDIGTKDSSASSFNGTSQGCKVKVTCAVSGLSVSMESPSDAECRCPSTTSDINASTWSVTSFSSSQENLSQPEVGSSLLPPAPSDVSEVVAAALRCAVRMLREWPSLRSQPSTPSLTPLAPLAAFRAVSEELPFFAPSPSRFCRRPQPHHLSLDAAQWQAVGGGAWGGAAAVGLSTPTGERATVRRGSSTSSLPSPTLSLESLSPTPVTPTSTAAAALPSRSLASVSLLLEASASAAASPAPSPSPSPSPRVPQKLRSALPRLTMTRSPRGATPGRAWGATSRLPGRAATPRSRGRGSGVAAASVTPKKTSGATPAARRAASTAAAATPSKSLAYSSPHTSASAPSLISTVSEEGTTPGRTRARTSRLPSSSASPRPPRTLWRM